MNRRQLKLDDVIRVLFKNVECIKWMVLMH